MDMTEEKEMAIKYLLQAEEYEERCLKEHAVTTAIIAIGYAIVDLSSSVERGLRRIEIATRDDLD